MKFNYKSRKGFTLIELLVVIGILVVLAAIAIPSVAGLIDRANVSADNTNANEMTNAMERFVSEYELFRQDIASGTFDVNNMDAAQGRVYNVTGADSIEDIRALESEAGFNGIRIDLDNKYAQNHATAKAVIENYMKTSSSTFEPKQSDMTYWYNTVTGYTVVAEKDINTATLENLLPTEIKYNSSQPASITEWIDLSSDIIFPDIRLFDAKTDVSKTTPGAVGIRISYCVPNPKFYDIDLTNIFLINNFEDMGLLDMDNTFGNPYCFGNKMNDINKNHMNSSNENMVSFNTLFIVSPEQFDLVKQFRIVLKYEEDGKTKYAYSPTFSCVYNDLKK